MIQLKKAFEGFKKYPQKLVNVTVENKDAVVDYDGVKEMIDKQAKKLDGKGRVLVRKSGTEPYVRVMVEAETQVLCDKTCDELVKYIISLGF